MSCATIVAGMDANAGLYGIGTWPGRQAAWESARSLLLAGDVGRAVTSYDRLLPHAAEIAGAADRSLFLEQAGTALRLRGRLRAAGNALEGAVASAEACGDAVRLASVLRSLAMLGSAREDVDAVAGVAARALRLARDDRRPAVQAAVHMIRGIDAHARGRAGVAVRDFRKAILVSRRLDARVRLDALRWLIAPTLSEGQVGRAERLTRLALRLAESLAPAPRDVRAWVTASLGWILERQGRWFEALEAYVAALSDMQAIALGQSLARVLWKLGLLTEEAGFHSLTLRIALALRAEAKRPARRETYDVPWEEKLLAASLSLGLSADLAPLAFAVERGTRRAALNENAGLAILDLQRYEAWAGEPERARALAETGARLFRSSGRDSDAARSRHWTMFELFLARIELDVTAGRLAAARRDLAQIESADAGRSHLRVRVKLDCLQARLALADDDPRRAWRRAARGWTLMRRLGFVRDLLEPGTLMTVALHRMAERATDGTVRERSRRQARMLAWCLGWLAARLDAAQRAPWAKTPPIASALEAIAAVDASLRPDRVLRAAKRPPMPLPRLPEIERGWELLSSSLSKILPGPASVKRDATRGKLRAALEAHGWNVTRAAAALGISRQGLNYKLRSVQLRRP